MADLKDLKFKLNTGQEIPALGFGECDGTVSKSLPHSDKQAERKADSQVLTTFHRHMAGSARQDEGRRRVCRQERI